VSNGESKNEVMAHTTSLLSNLDKNPVYWTLSSKAQSLKNEAIDSLEIAVFAPSCSLSQTSFSGLQGLDSLLRDRLPSVFDFESLGESNGFI